MTEALYIQRLRAVLRERYGSRLWLFKTHGSPYQTAGLPDILGVLNGRAFGIEVKQPGKVPTALQDRTMIDMEVAGTHTRLVYTHQSVSEVIQWLDQFAS